MEILWQFEDRCVSDFLPVPRWIDSDITAGGVAAVIQGGCESGAYMPAVTYHEALKTMNDHSDLLEEYLDGLGSLDDIPYTSWSGLACHIVSMAVEYWCYSIEDELEDLIVADEQDIE